jgi:hypothetical protein
MNDFPGLLRWLVAPFFPMSQGAVVHPEKLGQSLARKPQNLSGCGKLLGKGLAGGTRVIPQQPDDLGDVADRWRCCVGFPIVNGSLVDANLVYGNYPGNLGQKLMGRAGMILDLRW